MNNITHVYTLRTDLKDILRMRVHLKDNTYKEIKYKADYLLNPRPIPVPELWGRFAQVTDAERNWHKSQVRTLYIEDVVSAKANNPSAFGARVAIPLHAITPCKAVFWVAENRDASLNRNFSNYTTDSDNLLDGWNPCATAGVKYTGSHRINELPNDHFDRSEGYSFMPSTPEEPGYNCAAFAYNLTSLNADTGIVLEPLKATLVLSLADTDPFKNAMSVEKRYGDDGEIIPEEALEANIEAASTGNFIVHTKMLVMKKLTVQWNQQRQRIDYKISDDATDTGLPESK
jgi:hypothetical protein